jgi:hypothetical protein
VILLVRDERRVSVIKLTSHAPRADDYALKEWQKVGLAKPSAAQIKDVRSISEEALLRRIGKLSIVDAGELHKRLNPNR